MDDCDWLLSVEKVCDWLRIEPGVTVNFFLGHPVHIRNKMFKTFLTVFIGVVVLHLDRGKLWSRDDNNISTSRNYNCEKVEGKGKGKGKGEGKGGRAHCLDWTQNTRDTDWVIKLVIVCIAAFFSASQYLDS